MVSTWLNCCNEYEQCYISCVLVRVWFAEFEKEQMAAKADGRKGRSISFVTVLELILCHKVEVAERYSKRFLESFSTGGVNILSDLQNPTLHRPTRALCTLLLSEYRSVSPYF